MTAMPSIPGGLTWDPQDRLQKIRVFHVLADPEIRENAHHYIR